MRSLLGVGIYSIPEAARFAETTEAAVRRWLWGYSYLREGLRIRADALWAPELPAFNGSKAVSFRDLLEVRFVHTFRRRGVSLQTIRRALEITRREWETDSDYPFLAKRFKTDGKRIFVEAGDRDAANIFVNLVTGQTIDERLLLCPLYDGLEYDQHQRLQRWWPLGLDRSVVLDPRRRFGQPIVDGEGVPTAILARAAASEGSVQAAAQWYDASEESVEDAVDFERRIAA